ncbi:MAG: hypothetical protein WC657_02755 [Candidatus Paceibacterota bacterium]|jgi:hypothetical protein
MWNVVSDGPEKPKTSELAWELMLRDYPFSSYWEWDMLDEIFPQPSSVTERTFVPNIESDEEYKNLSVENLKEKSLLDRCITLRERLILELQYNEASNGNHLDHQSVTLCAGGPQDPKGLSVAGIAFRKEVDGGFRLDSWDIKYSYDHVRARIANE